MISWILLVVVFAGLCLSVYAHHVEQYAGKKKGYRAACDINDHVSCSKTFASKYGTIFGISNSVYGMIFYLIIFALSLMQETGYILVLSALAVLGSAYLAYVQYAKIRVFCLVCAGIYLINILLVVMSYRAAF
ncbi:MAG: vitamin K epoxide reductase family protein [Nanoarchaeota archaeon]